MSIALYNGKLSILDDGTQEMVGNLILKVDNGTGVVSTDKFHLNIGNRCGITDYCDDLLLGNNLYMDVSTGDWKYIENAAGLNFEIYKTFFSARTAPVPPSWGGEGTVASPVTYFTMYASGVLDINGPESQMLWLNTTQEDTYGGRETFAEFTGYTASSLYHTLGKVTCAHLGIGNFASDTDCAGYYDIALNSGADGTSPLSNFGFYSKALGDDDEIYITNANTALVIIIVEGRSEYMVAHIQDDGTPTLINSAGDVATSDTDNKLCLYDYGTGASIKNRLGSTQNISWYLMKR